MNPTGGLLWHARAWRRQGAWRGTCGQIGQWLGQVRPSSRELLIIGASAGWMMPSAWLQRFEKVSTFDIDRWAAPLFRLRHGAVLRRSGVDLRCHTSDAIGRLDEVLAENPRAAVLFDNVLGQLRFLHASIDTTAAQAMPGVHLVLTGAQWRAAGLKDMPPLANFVRPDGKPAATAARCPLAFERVRFVGEPVVAIVADTEQQAKDAAEAVVVDYEELPCAVTLQDALAPNAPLLSDAPDNRSAETRYGDAASVDKAFASAKHVVKLDIDNQRVAALSIEPRSVLAYVDQGRLTIRMSSQMPTGVRTVVSTLLGLPVGMNTSGRHTLFACRLINREQ